MDFKKNPEILCYVMQSVVLGEYDDHHEGMKVVSTLLGERPLRQQLGMFLFS
jgi:hypothetical protein